MESVTTKPIHSWNVRICHWINVVACGYLLVSGIHIFLDFPELYWGDTGFRGHPAVFKLEQLGMSWEMAGSLGDRKWGRNYHFTYVWVFLINGLIYVGWSLYTRHFKNRMVPRPDELTKAHLAQEVRDQLRWNWRRVMEPGSYATLQKISYLLLIFVYVPFMILSGVAQSPGFTAAMPWLLDIFGGRQSARTLHSVGTVFFVVFVGVHLFEIAATGFIKQVGAMITGGGKKNG